MIVPLLADLNEKNPSPKMVHDFLIARSFPPLNGVIEFTSGAHDPERDRIASDLLHLRYPRFLGRENMDIAPKIRECNLQVQAAVQKVDKSVQEMPRLTVAAINQAGIGSRRIPPLARMDRALLYAGYSPRDGRWACGHRSGSRQDTFCANRAQRPSA